MHQRNPNIIGMTESDHLRQLALDLSEGAASPEFIALRLRNLADHLDQSRGHRPLGA